jgi:hypothetical protein
MRAGVVPSVLLVGGCVVLVACGEQVAAPDSGPTPVTLPPGIVVDPGAPSADVDGAWVLTGGTIDGVPLLLVDGFPVTLTVGWGELGGTAACNVYGGFVVAAEGSISVGQLFRTEMGCEPPVMEYEAAYIDALSAVRSYVVTDDGLTLSGPSSTLAFAPAESGRAPGA